jgi:hypothetical protein
MGASGADGAIDIVSNHAAEYARNYACKLRAERRAGELLAEMDKAKPRGSNQHEDRSRQTTDPPRLSDLGITKDESSRWP